MPADLRSFEGEISTALTRLGRKSSFAEALAERASGLRLRLDTKATSPAVEPRLQGAIFRAWDGGRWVEAATSSLDAPSLGRAVEALEMAIAKGTGRAPAPGVPSTVRKEWTRGAPRPMRDVPVEQLIALCRDARGWAMSVPGVADASTGVSWEENERLYLNTAGARCFQRVGRAAARMMVIAIENGRAEFDFDQLGGVGGQEYLEFLSEKEAHRIARGATDLLKAKAPPTGEMPVLLDPGVTGLFAHESFGHGTEADQFVRDRSYLKPILGQEVGPEKLTIADDGAFPGGWGTIYCDDEGNPGKKNVLVDRGRFVAALHDRETAAAFHTTATGNTRRADFLSRPFVRMTNTYVEPGDWSLEELVREAKNGVLLERGTSGIEDPLGGQMQLKVKRGHLIENGKLTRLVTSMALSGKVLEFLRGIRGIEKGREIVIEPGFCGKGQTDLLPVGSGGVHLLSTAVVGPA